MSGTDHEATTMLQATMPLAATWGLTVLAGDGDGDSATRVALDAEEELCTAGGALHGGVLIALADSAGALCAFSRLPEGATGTTTLASATNLMAAGRPGMVIATATPLHAGRSTIVVEVKVHDQAGRLLTSTTQTQAVLRG